MAGKDLYLGRMIEGLSSKIDASMAKTDEQIAELVALRTSIVGGNIALNVKASDVEQQVFANSEITSPTVGSSPFSPVYTIFKSGIVQATGTVKFKAVCKDIKSNGKGGLYVKVGSTYYMDTVTETTNVWADIALTVPVTAGATFEFGAWSQGYLGDIGYVQANSLKICYDINDLSETGVFVY